MLNLKRKMMREYKTFGIQFRLNRAKMKNDALPLYVRITVNKKELKLA